MKIWRQIAGLCGMALGAGGIWLAWITQRVFSSSSFFQWGSWKDYAFLALLVALGVALIVVAYCFGFKWHAEPGARPNDDPAASVGNSNEPEGRHR